LPKKKDSFWRDFTIGVVSSITASFVIASFFNAQIQHLEAQLAEEKR